MAETTNNKQLFIQGAIVLIAALGIVVGPNILTDDLDNQYVCVVENDLALINDQLIHEFDGGVSGSLYSGYPYSDSRAGYIRCKQGDVTGEWNTLAEYAEKIGVTLEDLEITQDTDNETNIEPDLPVGKNKGNSINQYYCMPADGGCCEIC